jgi:hypothetical protein
VGHVRHRARHQRQVPRDLRRVLDLAMPRERADTHRPAFDTDARQLGDPVDVDEHRRRGQPHPERGEQALAAGKDARVVAVMLEELEDLVERVRPCVGKCRGLQEPLRR